MSITDATNYFPNTTIYYHWSSTTDADYTSDAWMAAFFDGPINPYGGKSSDTYVRCVRGGTITPSCTYTISSASQTFTSTGGTGSGTVTISVSANTTEASRTGNITIAGKTFAITQKK